MAACFFPPFRKILPPRPRRTRSDWSRCCGSVKALHCYSPSTSSTRRLRTPRRRWIRRSRPASGASKSSARIFIPQTRAAWRRYIISQRPANRWCFTPASCGTVSAHPADTTVRWSLSPCCPSRGCASRWRTFPGRGVMSASRCMASWTMRSRTSTPWAACASTTRRARPRFTAKTPCARRCSAAMTC